MIRLCIQCDCPLTILLGERRLLCVRCEKAPRPTYCVHPDCVRTRPAKALTPYGYVCDEHKDGWEPCQHVSVDRHGTETPCPRVRTPFTKTGLCRQHQKSMSNYTPQGRARRQLNKRRRLTKSARRVEKARAA